MNIFIGWSGEYSHEVALALKDWLCKLFEEIKEEIRVDVSSSEPGDKWLDELDKMLNRARGGILCLTQQSLASTWLTWEAAIISVKNKGFVIPYCLDIEPEEIPSPLSQFQASKADDEGTWKLVKRIYKRLPGDRENVGYLQKIFEHKWPTLEKSLETISRKKAHSSQLQRFESVVQKKSNNYHKALELVDAICKIPNINQVQRFVIALCGSAAIGKSTFARLLAQTLEEKKEQILEEKTGQIASILPTDAFALSRAEKREQCLQGYERKSHDLEGLNRSVEELIAGIPVNFRPYQHEDGKFGALQILKPTKILIIEGVYSFEPMEHHKISCLSDSENIKGYRVYLHADPGKAQELKFAADVTRRNKSVEEAFKELYKNYASYDKHIKKRYFHQRDFEIRVNQYWAYH